MLMMIDDDCFLGATELELKIHRELEYPNSFKNNYPEIWRWPYFLLPPEDQAHLDSIKAEK